MQLESCTSKTCWEPCCRQKLILFLMWWQGATSKTCWNTLSCTCAQICSLKLFSGQYYHIYLISGLFGTLQTARLRLRLLYPSTSIPDAHRVCLHQPTATPKMGRQVGWARWAWSWAMCRNTCLLRSTTCHSTTIIKFEITWLADLNTLKSIVANCAFSHEKFWLSWWTTPVN